MLSRHLTKLVKSLAQNGARDYGSISVGVLGVPFEKGQHKVGVSTAPSVLREYGLLEELKRIDDQIDVKDFGDISYTPQNQANKVTNMPFLEHVAACNKVLSENVCNILTSGRKLLTIGGDHSIGIGTVDGHIQAVGDASDVCVLWIDAHADINTNATSTSGHIHGMPLAILAKELAEYWPHLPGMEWQKAQLSVRNLAYIGLRSVDPYERFLIDKLGIPAYDMWDVQHYGISNVISSAFKKIDPYNRRSIHISFDIDSLDALEAPSTCIPLRGGLSVREGIHIVETAYLTGRLRAMDIVEINPAIGTDKDVRTTVEAAKEIACAAFGYCRRGTSPWNAVDIPQPKKNY